MNHPISTSVCLLAILLFLGACGSESEPIGPAWIDGGTHVANVSESVIPDTIRATDTLVVRLSAHLNDPIGRLALSHIETAWTAADVLELTVWTDVDLWVGGGQMPPTNLEVLHNHEIRVPPPFPVDRFVVRINQPRGAVDTETVVVAPE